MKNFAFIFPLVLFLFSFSGIMAQDNPACREDSIFVIVEQMPEFPGGDIGLRKYIASHIKYPEAPVEEVNIGKTYVKFCVNKKGDVERVKVVRSQHPKFDAEAIRVIKSLPKWKPGKIAGKPVCVWYTVPIYVHWQE